MVYDATTRQLLAASKMASPTQENAYRAAEAAMDTLVNHQPIPVPTVFRTIQESQVSMVSDDMYLPTIRTVKELNTLLHQEYTRVAQDSEHNLAPYRRLLLYDALGPTCAFTTPAEQIAQLKACRLSLTRADRMRARIALQTAKYVLSIWDAEIAHVSLLLPAEIENNIHYALNLMAEFDLPPQHRSPLLALLATRSVDYPRLREQVALIVDTLPPAQATLFYELIQMGISLSQADPGNCLRLELNSNLLLHWAVADGTFLAVANTELPQYTLDLAEAVWHNEVDLAAVLSYKAIIYQILSSNLGLVDEELPARAFDVATSTYEALNQALGFGPFDGVQITPDTREWALMGTGAAAASAVRAFSGIFDGPFATNMFDPQRQRAFWEWWLTEAVPQAWAAEADFDDSAINMQPFRAWVRATRVQVG